MSNLRIADISVDLKVQLKQRGIDENTVRAYIDALTNDATFPPIVVFQDGNSLWLADGFHRVSAYRFCGRQEVEADVRIGSRDEAIVYAATANAATGRPMSREQKKEAGERLIKMTGDSNMEIARKLAIADVTVMRWREKLSSTFVEDKKRIAHRNGTAYEINTANIGNGHKPNDDQPATQPELFTEENEAIPETKPDEPTQLEAKPCPPLPDSVRLICGDFAQVAQEIEPGSIDVIITDPPYPKEFLHLYGILAQQAARLLKPGGSLLVMCGQSYLPEIFALMCPHLAYHWTDAYLTPGGQSPQIWPRKINTFWKPLLWFVNGQYAGEWQGDVIKSAVNDNDKRFHHWGQSESGMAEIVSRYSLPGDLILDPFLGGGTTAVVALDLQRRFVGVDKDIAAIQTTQQRLSHGE